LRAALEQGEGQKLFDLASSDDLSRWSPGALSWFGEALRKAGAPEQAEAVLREVRRQRPGDFWANYRLAVFLLRSQPPRTEEALRFDTAAAALRPQSPGAHLNVGHELDALGRTDEAIAEYREAIRLKKDYPEAHCNLGNALRKKGRLDEAIAECREAIRLKPDLAEAHSNLGTALRDKGDMGGAVARYQEIIRLKPDSAIAHEGLGVTLRDMGNLEGAIDEFRQAIRLKEDDPLAHYNLGVALCDKQDWDGAVAEYREAIRLKPDYAEAHHNLSHALYNRCDDGGAVAECREALRLLEDFPEAHLSLGNFLRETGQFTEALTHLRRGHELGSKRPRWPYASAQRVEQCERFVELEGKLPAMLSGKAQPANVSERVEYADVCQKKRLYAAAVCLYREAITAQPDVAASPANEVRYRAAFAAALAGCGKGEDAAWLTDAERAGFRKQALDWLRADLDAWRGLLEKQPDKARPAVARQMRHWLQDTDFNGVRGPDALARLPEAERQDWQKLWADVAETLRRAGDSPPQAKGVDKKP
jgi:tetratricopeptide (TPR) repeat protein